MQFRSWDMNSVKTKINKLILRLASVGMFFFLMFPGGLSASHFRYGTMSWENPWDNGTIRLKMENGWRTGSGAFLETLGSRISSWVDINWGDGSDAEDITIKTISIDSIEGSSLTEI